MSVAQEENRHQQKDLPLARLLFQAGAAWVAREVLRCFQQLLKSLDRVPNTVHGTGLQRLVQILDGYEGKPTLSLYFPLEDSQNHRFHYSIPPLLASNWLYTNLPLIQK